MTLLRNLRDDVSARGWKWVGGKILGKARSLLYFSETLRLMQTELGANTTAPGDTGRSAIRLDFDDLVNWKVENALRLPHVLRDRYRRGDRCWGVMSDGHLVHVAWESSGRLPIDRGCVIATPHDVLAIFDMYTYPEHRGRGHQSFILLAICADAQQRGFRAAVATVHQGNVPSLRAFTRTGFRDVGSVRRRVLFGIQFARLDTGSSRALFGHT